MSTRAVIGTEASYPKGRYCHNDGYACWLGKSLIRLIQRDGVEKVQQMLTEDHYGWSSIDPRQSFKKYDKKFYDERFACVPKYGIAYTTEQGQTYPEDWENVTDEEWGYVIKNDGTIDVYAYNRKIGCIDTSSDTAVEDMCDLEKDVYAGMRENLT